VLNPCFYRTDSIPVADFLGPAWVFIGLVAAGAGIGVLHLLAIGVRDGTAAHDFRLKVVTLRDDYRRQMKASAGDEVIEVEVVGEVPAGAVPAEARQAA
jgi:hypothetical protein